MIYLHLAMCEIVLFIIFLLTPVNMDILCAHHHWQNYLNINPLTPITPRELLVAFPCEVALKYLLLDCGDEKTQSKIPPP